MNDDETIYAVRILLESRHSASALPPAPALFEDRVVLLVARDEDQARSRAAQELAEHPERYENVYGEEISWEFVEFLDVKLLPGRRFEDGMDAYYSFLDARGVELVRSALAPSVED